MNKQKQGKSQSLKLNLKNKLHIKKIQRLMVIISILLRKLQKELCLLPLLPLSAECNELNDLNAKITKAELKKLEEKESDRKRIIFISLEMEINGKICEGKIELGEKTCQIPCNDILNIPFKKLSPFKICETEITEKENGREWKIFREKWRKIT